MQLPASAFALAARVDGSDSAGPVHEAAPFTKLRPVVRDNYKMIEDLVADRR